MANYKHICDLSYCNKHGECIFKNAESVLKSDAYQVSLGYEINSDIILCYQKEDIGFKKEEPIISKIESKEKLLCENPKCKLGNPISEVRHNNEINLCKHCNDLIHLYKTNSELAMYFNNKTKIIKLLSIIRELEKENSINPQEVIRCINIYCATTENITQHHLIPKPYRKGIEGKIERVPLCEDCHKKVHRMKTNGELARNYNTKEALIELLSSDIIFRVQRMMSVASNEYAMVV